MKQTERGRDDFHTFALSLNISAYLSLYFQLFRASLLLISLHPTFNLHEVKEKRKMCNGSTLLNRHSQIMDYPITETSRVALCF